MEKRGRNRDIFGSRAIVQTTGAASAAAKGGQTPTGTRLPGPTD